MALWFSDMRAAVIALFMAAANAHAHAHAHQRGGSEGCQRIAPLRSCIHTAQRVHHVGAGCKGLTRYHEMQDVCAAEGQVTNTWHKMVQANAGIAPLKKDTSRCCSSQLTANQRTTGDAADALLLSQ